MFQILSKVKQGLGFLKLFQTFNGGEQTVSTIRGLLPTLLVNSAYKEEITSLFGMLGAEFDDRQIIDIKIGDILDALGKIDQQQALKMIDDMGSKVGQPTESASVVGSYRAIATPASCPRCGHGFTVM